MDPFSDHAITAELIILRQAGLQQVIVNPQESNPAVWDVAFFLREGLYEGAVVKGHIFLGDTFPHLKTPPALRLLQFLFHPQVDPSDFSINLSWTSWNPDEDRVWHILQKAVQILESCDSQNAVNEEAASLINQNQMQDLQLKANACHRDLDMQTYSTVSDEEFGIKFSQWKPETHGEVLSHMKKSSQLPLDRNTTNRGYSFIQQAEDGGFQILHGRHNE